MSKPQTVLNGQKPGNDNNHSARVIIKSLIHDLDLNVYALELRFWKIDGRKGGLTVPRSLTAAPQEVFRQLLDAGALLPEDRKQASEFVHAALLSLPAYRIATTRRGGWHQGSYVTPTDTIGTESATLRFAGPEAADPSVWIWEGSSKAWREGFLDPCEASSFLTFGHSIGYAAPLLDVLGEDEGAIFHLYGHSSTGKTLVARSVH